MSTVTSRHCGWSGAAADGVLAAVKECHQAEAGVEVCGLGAVALLIPPPKEK